MFTFFRLFASVAAIVALVQPAEARLSMRCEVWLLNVLRAPLTRFHGMQAHYLTCRERLRTALSLSEQVQPTS